MQCEPRMQFLSALQAVCDLSKPMKCGTSCSLIIILHSIGPLRPHAVQTLGQFDQPDERCITFGQLQVRQH